GHTVVLAESGNKALDAWRKQTFDIVLMDIQMAEMVVFEATSMIREHEKSTGQHIPIIALTAHAMQGDRERCLAAGMDDYVAKPVSRDAFRNALERCAALVAARRQAANAAAGAPEPHAPVDPLAILAAELERGEHAESLADAQAALEKARARPEPLRALGGLTR